ncbi:MAG: M20/M25/M40 family metallo-hydrolase, partial [Bacteroidota bacterium]|nr:M20/M25/M40 family metallo-hydrolase [Bacteroidota bacterium]MDX5429430.1 M20/M25/M40 family metallo-hydrolase [Bacteroidota bacterium]MDX5468221.1 M20/M25/M40 family metallo-hydrolase [Bacteroidota bacterium]
SMSVNTFPGAMEVKVEGRELKPGEDFLVKASANSLKGTFTLRHVSLSDLRIDKRFYELMGQDLKKQILVLDTMTYEDERIDKRYKAIQYHQIKSAGVIIKSKRRLLWTVAQEQANYLTLEVTPEAIRNEDVSISLNIKAKWIKKYTARNVVAQIKGTLHPDSFLMITAHYDHLGKMGKTTFFPGANDNASGTAMLLALARYYAKNPQPYTLVFVAFTAEEAGLVGSKYFTEHAPIDLKRIRFLMNLDLEGTGADGITAVNATVFEEDFKLLTSINTELNLLKTVAPRGKAANSDHYWFTELGVPSFFIYQMGEYGHYHDPGDQPQKLPLSAFEETQKLIIAFYQALQGSR